MDEFGAWDEVRDGAGYDTVRVLHVDDDPDFTELASLSLERESDAFEVLSEHSAAAGLDRLSDEDFDCIVCDYQMPGKTGLEFCQQISGKAAQLPFILFTGKGSEEVASDAFAAGVTDYLQKGMGTDQFTVLANRIEQAVANARSHRQLERTQQRFKTLVEESNDAILVIDDDGDILYATPATERILGKNPEALVGSNGFDPLHPDDVDEVSAEFAKMLEDPAYRATADFRYKHADGSWIWLEGRTRNLRSNDIIEGIVVYVRDIDARKENEQEMRRREQKFRAVFEEAFDAMVLADDNGEYVDVNPAACDLFGLGKEELLGRSIREFAPAEFDVDRAWQDFEDSERERGLFPLVRSDGDRRVVEFAASYNVIPHRHLSILRDVTDRELENWDALIQ